MKIVTISILDEKYKQIYFNQLDTSLQAKHMLTITNFVQSLDSFGGDNFRDSLERVDLRSLWIEFLTLNDVNIMLLITVDPTTIDRNLIRYNNYIENLHNYLMSIIDKPNFSLLETKSINIFTMQFKMYLQMFPIPRLGMIHELDKKPIYNVGEIYVCEPSGVPLINASYKDISYGDPIIVSGMLSTINNFSAISFNKRINKIVLNQQILFFRQGEEYLYVIVVHTDAPDVKNIPTHIEKNVNKLLKSISLSVDWILQENNDTSILTVIDTCVTKYPIQ